MKQMGRRRAPGKKLQESTSELEDAKPQEVALFFWFITRQPKIE